MRWRCESTSSLSSAITPRRLQLILLTYKATCRWSEAAQAAACKEPNWEVQGDRQQAAAAAGGGP